MMVRKIFFFLLCLGLSSSLQATNYYINTAVGKDSNQGTSSAQSWRTVLPLSTVQLKPGDSILFATGQRFTGMLSLIDVKGLIQHPVVVASYPYKEHKTKPVLDAGNDLNALLIRNSSFIHVNGIEFTGIKPYQKPGMANKAEMRCGILVEVTRAEAFQHIVLTDILVHDVYYNPPGFTRSAAEIRSANGTQSYGWGVRFINNTKGGLLTDVHVLRSEIFNVSHTGLKFTATVNGIQHIEIAECKVYQTGGPGMQFSGVTDAHIHHNKVDHSGSTADSRNWGRGSGLWTWSCTNVLIEHNRFENANGPGDSAGVHIDYNCSHVVVQYNVSANNAGGFCEILGNNYNCAYRYNISINDGYRVKGINGAFQEGKIFWLSGYQGNEKKNAGPYNSYFYNNSIYVAGNIIPKIAVSSSADGVLIANNIFYFEGATQVVAGDQKKQEVDLDGIPHVLFNNNLFLRPDNWPSDFSIQDKAPIIGDPGFKKKGGLHVEDYIPSNKKLVINRGVQIQQIPDDSIGLRIGLKVHQDILGKPIKGLPDMGAIELTETEVAGKSGKPNIIIILTDDQGYGDVGFNGCTDIPTPNIDRIAKNGVVFRQAYVSYAVCAPSRAGLLTGRYQDRFGYSRNPLYKPLDPEMGLALTEQMLPEFLQRSGYVTMGIGKWHLGAHEIYRPWQRGFNEYFGFLGGGHRYFPGEYNIANPDSAKNEAESYRTKLIRNEQVVEESEYLTDALSREAVSFIERNKMQPFFLYLAYNAPHAPLQATEKYLNRFSQITDPKRKTYAAMVSAVDDGVGAVLNKLQQLDLADNTIVFFLSDNGGPEQDNGSDNGRLRGGKGSFFEGGIRVPFAVQWPRQIQAGSEYDQPVISLDIFSTIAANVAGAPAPKNPLDGADLLPYLNGTRKGSPHEFLFWRQYDQKRYAVVHQSGMKELIARDTIAELFDLKTDIGEQTNVADKNKPLLERIDKLRKDWEVNMIAPAIWGLNQEKLYTPGKKPQQNN